MAKGANRHVPFLVAFVSDKEGRPIHIECEGVRYGITGYPKELMDWLKKRGLSYSGSQISEPGAVASSGTLVKFKLPRELIAEFREHWLTRELPEPEPEPLPDGPRSCVLKKRYTERGLADRAMFLLITSRHYIPRPGRTLRVYGCPHCGTFHLGHQESGTTPFEPIYDTPRPVPRERP